jgi:predicted secreted protein
MAFNHGSKASFQVNDGTSLRDLSSYLTSVSFPQTVDTAEVSTLGATSKSYIVGLKDATISIEGIYDPTADGYLNTIAGLTTATAFEYYPNGTPVGSTKPKFSGNCILTSYEVSAPVDGAASFTAEFQVSGAVTRAVA